VSSKLFLTPKNVVRNVGVIRENTTKEDMASDASIFRKEYLNETRAGITIPEHAIALQNNIRDSRA
jgi:hypothetical protein